MTYGYARVSTDGQSVPAQVAALTAAGAGKRTRGEEAPHLKRQSAAKRTIGWWNAPTPGFIAVAAS